MELCIDLEREEEKLLELKAIISSKDKEIILLEELNRELKFQIEELLIELKVVQRRNDTNNLISYEERVESRIPDEEDSSIIGLLHEKVNSLEKQLQETNKKYKNLQQIVYSS